MFRVLPTFIFSAMLGIVATACSGRQGSNLEGADIELQLDRAIASISVNAVPSPDGEVHNVKLTPQIRQENGSIILDQVSSEDQSVNALLYEVKYDSNLMQLNNASFIEGIQKSDSGSDSVELITERFAGRLSLGQVTARLTDEPVHPGQVLVRVELMPGASRQTAAFSPEDSGMKLRHNQQFVNLDVPFQRNQIGTSNSYEIIWEEAIDADYDHNGEVNISDLTPIGRYLITNLVDPTDFQQDLSGDWIIDRDLHKVAKRNINQIGAPHGAGPHEPVFRYETGMPFTMNGDPSFFTTISDVTPIGVNIQNSAQGYDIYLVTCATGTIPEDGNTQPINFSSPLATVSRPDSFDVKIAALGMGEYGDMTYAEFCTTQCLGDEQRMGEEPLDSDFRIYKKIIEVPATLPQGDTYVVVTPRPGNLNVTDFDDLGAYTYGSCLAEGTMRYPEPSAEAKEQVRPAFPDFGAEVPGADHAFFSRSRRNYDQQAYQSESQYRQPFHAAAAHPHG